MHAEPARKAAELAGSTPRSAGTASWGHVPAVTERRRLWSDSSDYWTALNSESYPMEWLACAAQGIFYAVNFSGFF